MKNIFMVYSELFSGKEIVENRIQVNYLNIYISLSHYKGGGLSKCIPVELMLKISTAFKNA